MKKNILQKVIQGRLNVAEAARLLNKDRSNIYHYSNKRKNEK